MTRIAASLIALTCLCLPACGGDDDDGGGDDAADDGGGGDAETPTLTALQSEIFTPTCARAGCHGGEARESGLNLEGPVHGKLVGQPSNAVPSRTLVVAGDSEASYIVEKLTSNMPEAGVRMPIGGSLPATRIERLRAWIDAGALDD